MPNEVPELPEANIGRYAFELAISEPAALVFDIAVPHNEDSIDSTTTVANRVTFGSIAERNDLAAAYFVESTLIHQNSDLTSVVEQIIEIFSREAQCQDRVSVRICLGMNDHTDVLAALAASVTRTNVFKLLGLAGELVRELPSVNADSLIDLIGAQNRFTANDAASGLFFSDLTRILEQRLDLAESLLVAIRRRIDSGNASVYLIAFHALLKSDRAHQAALSISSDLVSEDVILRTAALQTVGAVLNAVESTDVAEICFRAIEANIASDDPAIRTSVFRAVAESLGRTQQFHSALYALVSSGSNEAVVVFARAFANPRTCELLSPDLRMEECVVLLCEHANDITAWALDSLLANLIQERRVKEFLTGIIAFASSYNVGDVELWERLASSAHALASDLSFISIMLTACLSDSRKRVREMAGSFVTSSIVELPNELNFDAELLMSMDDSTIKTLCIRTIAFVMTPAQVSLVLSVLEASHERKEIRDFLEELLLDEIAADYPGQLRTLMVERVDSGRWKAPELKILVRRISEQVDAKACKFNELPRLREIEVGEMIQSGLDKRRRKMFNKAFRESQSRSVFSRLATHIPLKGGRRYFTRGDDTVIPTTELKQIETQMYIPRRLICDPVGLELRNLFYKYGQIGFNS